MYKDCWMMLEAKCHVAHVALLRHRQSLHTVDLTTWVASRDLGRPRNDKDEKKMFTPSPPRLRWRHEARLRLRLLPYTKEVQSRRKLYIHRNSLQLIATGITSSHRTPLCIR